MRNFLERREADFSKFPLCHFNNCFCFIAINASCPNKVFTFDSVYGTGATNEEIYHEDVSPLVDGILQGYNGCIFAYGQTSCGKTFSMQGTMFKGKRKCSCNFIPFILIKKNFDSPLMASSLAQLLENSSKLTFSEGISYPELSNSLDKIL